MCAAVTDETEQQPGNEEERRSSLKLKHFQYPKPLEAVTIMPALDEMNFTNQEKCALNNMWRYVKPNIRKHSIRIFKFFYIQHENSINLFRDENDTINTTCLYKHSHWVMRLYGTLIENALGNSSQFHILVSAALQAHKKHMVERERIMLYGETINEYFLHYLKKNMSPTLSKALEKFIMYVAKMHPTTAVEPRVEKSLFKVRRRLHRSINMPVARSKSVAENGSVIENRRSTYN